MGLSTRSHHAKEVTNQADSKDKELKIALYDLQPTASSESSDLLLINPIEVRP
jgi:hypothetical protein